MTITEALIAIVIAAGVMIAAVEATRSGAARTGISLLEMEAVARAETLLATAGVDFPLAPGRIEGAQDEDVIWSVDIERSDSTLSKPIAFRVTSNVTIARAGNTVQQSLSTLKLSWGVRQ
jgi:hypothetical protein